MKSAFNLANDSEGASRVVYCHTSRTLGLRLRSGDAFVYLDVEPATFAALEASFHVGRFVIKHIVPSHRGDAYFRGRV